MRQQLPLPRLVDLADDRVVADVLLDRVFEVQSRRAHASLSIARSFALRARGLRATSASAGTTGRFVSTRSAIRRLRERAERVLDDAILERVKRDDREPRAGQQPARPPRGTRPAPRARG